MSEQTEARRLIESAFEETTPRAREALATFHAAADAYDRGNSHETAMLLTWGVDGDSDPAQAAHDVAAAGAVAVARRLAGLPCDCGDENCTGPEIEARGKDVGSIHRAAEALVNVASARRLALLANMLDRFHQESTQDDVCTLVMVLVTMRGKADRLATRYR